MNTNDHTTKIKDRKTKSDEKMKILRGKAKHQDSETIMLYIYKFRKIKFIQIKFKSDKAERKETDLVQHNINK